MDKIIESIELTTSTVCKNAKEYYANKKLTAQHPDVTKANCVNFLDDYRCAVSASYPEEWKESGGPMTYVGGVESGRIKTPPHATTIANIHTIQVAHDSWAQARNRGMSDEIINYLEKHFVSLINSYYYEL